MGGTRRYTNSNNSVLVNETGSVHGETGMGNSSHSSKIISTTSSAAVEGVGLQSIPSYSTSNPSSMVDVAGSCTWSDVISGSETIYGSVLVTKAVLGRALVPCLRWTRGLKITGVGCCYPPHSRRW